MKAIVDAGHIEKHVLGVSAKDCALTGFIAAGNRARFPIDVYDLESGDHYRFVESEEQTNVEEKKPSGRIFFQKEVSTRAAR
jgi:hypothetical protein